MLKSNTPLLCNIIIIIITTIRLIRRTIVIADEGEWGRDVAVLNVCMSGNRKSILLKHVAFLRFSFIGEGNVGLVHNGFIR